MHKKLLLILFMYSFGVLAQTSVTSKTVLIPQKSVVNPKTVAPSFAPKVTSIEAPVPNGESYKAFLGRQKSKSAEMYPPTSGRSQSVSYGQAPNPVKRHEMSTKSYIAQIDLEGIYLGGTPLDNTMAFAGDYLLASMNSFLWAYDITHDSNLFVDEYGTTYNISFATFGQDYITNPMTEFPFDPKLLYIPHFDRFVFTFLSGRTPSDSKIILGFSTTNNPLDPWNVYMLPGNPRNLDQWTDFPMFSYDGTNLYYSVNILKANTSWQLGFQGSIIWQVPLSEGFSGTTPLTATLHDDIKYDGSYIRNLTPVHPGNIPINDFKMTFFSNRNFDLQNDSLFVLKFAQQDTNMVATVDMVKLPQPYGMPPNGIQADDDPTDETDGLQTNDSRFLGAVEYADSQGNRTIEFVGNTKSFTNGRSAIYHGIVQNPENIIAANITAEVITVDSLDFGYPNITHVTNKMGCNTGTIIGFNHTSSTTNAGISAIYHSKMEGYSDIIRLKEGDGYVARLSGSYERWGDYFGIQTDPQNPSRIYTSGFYGTDNRKSSSWFNELIMPDTQMIEYTITNAPQDVINCKQVTTIDIQNGYAPYTVNWETGDSGNVAEFNLCEYNSIAFKITDASGCAVRGAVEGNTRLQNISQSVYPNPVTDQMNVTFTMETAGQTRFEVYNVLGQLITTLGDVEVAQGANLFTFSTAPLEKGQYFLVIKGNSDNIIIQKPFVKL